MMLHYPEAERGFVCRTPNTFFRYHGWPSVTKDADGVLYAVDSAFRVSHICPFGKTALYIYCVFAHILRFKPACRFC